LPAGSKTAQCTGHGFADASHPTPELAGQSLAAGTTRFTTVVTDKVKLKVRKRGPHTRTVTLHLNPLGKQLLTESGTLEVFVVVNEKDNTGRTGALTALVNLRRHR
jgi:hypothetical protein